jgi:phenylalanyl-tRNA synthetase beta chain
MRVSLRWLQQFVSTDALTPSQIAATLTGCGLEVEGVEDLSTPLRGVVVGRILSLEPHPDAARLRVCQVDAGQGEPLQIVCGAPNAAADLVVPVALPGASLPNGMQIGRASLRGVDSAGMLCSARELGLGDSHEGLMVLNGDAAVGTPLSSLLGRDDIVIELSVTPNRSDCLSIRGVARDFAAAGGRTLCDPLKALSAPNAGNSTGGIRASVRTADCTLYSLTRIDGIGGTASPAWLAAQLESVGQRSINLAADLTNYVLMAVGQPMHAFDLDRITGDELWVDYATEGETFVGLDGQERTLTGRELTIRDASGAIALAGVMGGQSTAVTAATRSILLESAHFSPAAVRTTAKLHGLRTESSYRFERSVDVSTSLTAAVWACNLANDWMAGAPVMVHPTTVAGANAAGAHPEGQIRMALDFPERMLGIAFSESELVACLTALGLDVTTEADSVVVALSARRPDLLRPVDLVEELGRIRGLDSIPASLPSGVVGSRHQVREDGGGLHQPILQNRFRLGIRRVKDAMVAAGFSEAVTIALVDPDRDSSVSDAPAPALVNAMSRTMSVLRTSLLPGLLRSVSINLAAGNERVSLFEVGGVFDARQATDGAPEEQCVAAVLSGPRPGALFQHGAADADGWDLSTALSAVGAAVGRRLNCSAPTAPLPWLYPGEQAVILCDGEVVGWLGQVHPDALDPLEIEQPVFAMQVRLTSILDRPLVVPQARSVPRRSPSTRDVALILNERTPWTTVDACIRGARPEWLESWEVFDRYSGEQLPAGKVSLGVRFLYRSVDQSITDEQLGEMHEQMVSRITSELSATRRA